MYVFDPPIVVVPSSTTFNKSVPELFSTSNAVVADVAPDPFTCSLADGLVPAPIPTFRLWSILNALSACMFKLIPVCPLTSILLPLDVALIWAT